MVKVVVVGGGWSGCAAALSAAKAGAHVILLERTDMLLGTGLVGGIFRNNGRFTAAEESIAMGGGDLFVAMDANSRHKGVNFPGHSHASFYDVTTMEPLVKKILQNYGIEICLKSRVSDVVKSGKILQSLTLDNGDLIKGDAFVDTTGTAGPMGNCLTYGNGCAMCVLRCPSFGPRISVAAKAEVKEFMGQKVDGTFGAMSGSCKLNKDSLSQEIRDQLESSGVVVIPLPKNLQRNDCLGKKACSQYAVPEYAANLVLLDTGHAKLMTSFFPLDELRTIPGLERARYEDPYAGGIGNSMRYLGIAPCNNTLQIDGIDNLFCGGEKSAILVGHTEAVVTGLLAGNNAVMLYTKRHAILGKGNLNFIIFTYIDGLDEPDQHRSLFRFGALTPNAAKIFKGRNDFF
ncbi:MAG: FAD-dependent oxidoreductase [Veillonellales bacterium]